MRRNKCGFFKIWVCVTIVFLRLFDATAQTDTTKVLSVAEFVAAVKQYHPVAKQAMLISEQAKAELRIARGGFDPLLYSDYNRKTYDGNSYYSYFENKIAVPTWYGIEVKAGYDFVYGDRINNENKLPNDGLGYLGISVPLAKNLFIDKRRAALKQAQIFREASEQQRLIILNDLLLDALTTYYEWAWSYREYSVYKEAVQLASIRFEATKKSAEFGDKPAIDTTEALTQLQSRLLQLSDARLKFISNGLELSNFLWLENDEPLPFDTTIVPVALNSDYIESIIELSRLDDLVSEVRLNHPQVLNYNFKLKQLDIERRLKIENLKPTLNANYNILSERFNFRSSNGLVLSNNYKFGVNFSMPLTFAQGRGELKLAKLKILDTRYQLNYKTQEIVNKLRTYFNQLITLQQQTKIYQESLVGFKRLLDGELMRFTRGESSLFLVNARENRYLEAQIKLSELQAKYFITEAKVKWAAGNFNQ
jgi:outer membrane protein TolC